MSRNITKAQPAGYAAFHDTMHMEAGAAVAELIRTKGSAIMGGAL